MMTISAQRAKFGVYVGRFSPFHIGHQRVLETMIEDCGIENCLVLIGSCNQALSEKTPFDFVTRLSWMKTLYPLIKVSGIPDYGNDKTWLIHLDSLLDLWLANHPNCQRQEKNASTLCCFYSGSEEDIEFFLIAGYQTKICSRHDGSGPVISATEIRQRLKQNLSIKGLVPEEIRETVENNIKTIV
jgi:nicotinic acid mononucleotide adenylyltransferase